MVNVDEDAALTPQEAPVEEAAAVVSDASPMPDLAMAPRPSDANLPSSSSGNALAAAGEIFQPSPSMHACNGLGFLTGLPGILIFEAAAMPRPAVDTRQRRCAHQGW